MTTFNLKQVTVPLFGEVEARTPKWFRAFAAAPANTQVRLDDPALDIIAKELGFDAEGLAGDARRYVDGSYREQARGMGGSSLGSLGEILTFIVNRAKPGRKIVRVESWRVGANQTPKGSLFPQPDFIFVDPSGQPTALEVKSTEAFNFIDLRDTPKRWTWLRPCSSVGYCRERALPQLAYVNGSVAPQQHQLALRGGSVVPFPVDRGVAAAVLAVDGRVNKLRKNAKLRTPKDCRNAQRDCWSCISPVCHFTIVTMPNAPGRLSLAGTDQGGSALWLGAYQRWSQALAARDLIAVRSTIDALADSTARWLARSEGPVRDVLRAFWGSYLGDVTRARGFDVNVPGQLGGLDREGLDFEWSPAPLGQPQNTEVGLDEIGRVLSGVQDDEGSVASFINSVRLQGDGPVRESLSIGVVEDFVEFRLASNAWWASESVASTEHAARIAERLFGVAMVASQRQTSLDGYSPRLQEVVAHVGDQVVRLGWESVSAAPGTHSWCRWCREIEHAPRRWPPWPALLASGDPRLRLRVLRDGRAELRVQRALFGRTG